MSETSDYQRGVTDAKKAIAAEIKKMSIYFDKFECYGGRYSSVSGTETVDTADLIRIIGEIEVEDV